MRLFDALAATWPAAETRALGPWTLRRGAGGGKRASAATLDGPPAAAAATLPRAEAAARAWGQRPLVLIRPGEDALDALLAERGFAALDPTLVLAAPAAALAFDVTPEEAIDCAGPLACMAAIWAAGGIGPARLAVMDRAAGPKTWLLGRLGDRPAACGFVALHAGVAMLHALEVAPGSRRRGLAALVVRAAAGWARERGADTIAMAVTEANAASRGLAGRLGFVEAARYHYRRAT